ncbi:ATP-dependent DNA helicase [Clostridium botulinum]|uniref:ATP-dependent helicase n=1 Tax=Clostridium botulinum TaxID=1491 RepID=A0A9Q1ZAT3_CLOBO|nr:ATP-dependent DNA helicase [Clostridium botulinum]AEB74744.1 DNA repair helicase, truncation, putative [Clostridium botulinum BKT015925]KEI02777.1 ATP-dependent helicase [Clostridium botulinum D str. 16868]KEI03095.1 ATP-dependent helicase [Clostridium botulinum C/D str. Sp77]KLU76236.1 ATP-dependent helicase [Clostridium botulinum V891]KOA74621.1 ATP-dependent helicase [Clostridium botulinum]
MKEKDTIKVSVRNLVEFILRFGDLVSTFTGTSRNVDAIKVHQKLQKSGGEGYTPEVPLTYTVKKDDITLEIGGRADGIIKNDNNITIDEIKTTTRPLEFIDEDYNLIHWAQAKCYGFIYCKNNNLHSIDIQLTYYEMDTKEIKRFKKKFNFIELEEFFFQVVNKYIYWAKNLKEFINIRDRSIKKLSFPFKSYRKGQRKLAVSVYKTIVEGKKFFAEAPTGIGKTIATLFPSIKAMGEGYTSKIFYLTAKTITRTAAEKAIENMRNQGLKIKSVTLTAKDKVCFSKDKGCDPESCEFAKGHFDRINNAIYDIYKEDIFSREVIEKYSKKHKVCPFEFSLELCNVADCIICDYNYVFDPRVYLKQFFSDGKSDFTLLIDEGHNLVDRAREMFSAEINKKEILNLKKDTNKSAKTVSKVLNKINSFMIDLRKKCEVNSNILVSKDAHKEVIPHLREFSYVCEKWILENKNTNESFKEELLNFYFKVLAFIRTYEYYDKKYITYAEKVKDDVRLKLFCLDPSHLIEESMKKGRATIVFSATLMPMDYYIDILGGCQEDYRLKLQSPFNRENICLIMDNNISTKFKMREFTYDNIVSDIEGVIKSKIGNYLVFFPSYKYMNEVYDRFIENNIEAKVIRQEIYMSEEDREKFLDNFCENPKETLVSFAVMGGLFSEGIDLTHDRLIGTIIVSVGLPQVCLERNIISDYFKDKNGKGFEYAYMYPGMNKVMQAAGRVIRTEKDKGIILLIDERFRFKNYFDLFPREWRDIAQISGFQEVKDKVIDFWQK